MREKFEKWISGKNPTIDLSFKDGYYLFPLTESFWECWQESRAPHNLYDASCLFEKNKVKKQEKTMRIPSISGACPDP